MTFEVAGEAYDRFMGRYSRPLAHSLTDWLDVRMGERALDVGCGPGALTAQLVERLGPDRVSAIDPSAPFVEACRERFPDVDVRLGNAESLPYDDASFDIAGACLVVHFMKDPVAGHRRDGPGDQARLLGRRDGLGPRWRTRADGACLVGAGRDRSRPSG